MHQHVGTRRSQFKGDGAADAAGGASHDGALPLQIAISRARPQITQ